MAETPFKLKSGNTTSFKQMGSTPVKDKKEYGPYSYHHNTQKATKEHHGDPHGPAPTKQIDWEAMHAKAKEKYSRYDDLTTEEYKAEALRQSKSKKETGDYDVSGVYDHRGKKTIKTSKTVPDAEPEAVKEKPKKKKGNWLTRTLKRFDDEVQSRMKTPRSDWDKEGYESERKARYAEYDAGPNKMKSPAKQTEKEYLAPGGKEGYEGRKKRAGKKYARLVEKKHKVREKGDIALHAGKKRKEERLYKKEERIRQRSIKARKKHQSKQE